MASKGLLPSSADGHRHPQEACCGTSVKKAGAGGGSGSAVAHAGQGPAAPPQQPGRRDRRPVRRREACQGAGLAVPTGGGCGGWINEARVAELCRRFPDLVVKNGFFDEARGPSHENKRSRSAPPGLRAPQGCIEARKLSELLREAVESLYKDRLKPEGVLLKRRFQELFGVDLPLDFLMKVCERGGLRVEAAKRKSGSAFSVFFPKLDGDFVDPNNARNLDSRLDPVYQSLKSYVEERGWNEVEDHTTCNYELARVLHARISSLSDYRLGEIYLVVSKLIMERVIGHRRDGDFAYLVPFALSDEQRKLQDSPQHAGDGDWRELATNIGLLLQDDKSGKGIVLSRLKGRYLRKFGVALEEFRFGYTKLAELLRDERLGGVCEVPPNGTTEARAYAPRSGPGVGARRPAQVQRKGWPGHALAGPA